MASKTFLLCMGAPRCGTTWLYHYLRAFDEVTFGFKKEFHVFDAVYLPHCRYFVNPTPVTGATRQRSFMERYLREQQRLAAFRGNHALYFDYFASLLDEDGRHITADISPTYLPLPPRVLALVRDEFARRGVGVKVILLMRDPVERIISSCRLALRLRRFRGERLARSRCLAEFLPTFSRAEHVGQNTDYASAIGNIQSVFAGEQVHFGFYESMFSVDEIQRLSDFIGIPARPELGEVVYNSSRPGRPTIDAGTLACIRDRYHQQYIACDALFPDARLPQAWRYFVAD